MRATDQNSGTALSIGVFFSVMIAGLASTLPQTLRRGLIGSGVPVTVAHEVEALPQLSYRAYSGRIASCMPCRVAGFAVTLIFVIFDSSLTAKASTICSRPAGA